MADFTEQPKKTDDKIINEEPIIDFSEVEQNEFIQKCQNINFECMYADVNEMRVTTNYTDYIINIHKKDFKYYIIVYNII